MKRTVLFLFALLMSVGFSFAAVIDFESDALGTVYPGIGYNPATDVNAVVESNPAGEGQSLHITCNNWDASAQFVVTLPEGKTLADVEKVTFDVYLPSVDNTPAGQTPNSYKSFDYYFGAPDATFSTDDKAVANNLIQNPSDNPAQTWITKEFVPTIGNDFLSLNQFSFGLGLNIDKFDYYIDNITFVLAAGTTVLTPSSNAPGVHVYDQYGAGDGYSGANIILGDDASVWPWSTAGDDGVAFTPEKDATYRMTFNVTSVPTKPADITTGSQGFRVRWLEDNSNGNYTVADARVVTKVAPWNVPFTADQIPAIIPAYFQNTNAGNETQTYSIDIIMDGTQLADSLIGNIAIRGGGGSNAFVINTLVITDADGNQLVNYDKTATGIVPVKPDVTNVYNIDGGIIVNANNEKVSIYAIDGRLVKQTIAGQGTIIPLQQGLYIVKVGAAKAVKVVVK